VVVKISGVNNQIKQNFCSIEIICELLLNNTLCGIEIICKLLLKILGKKTLSKAPDARGAESLSDGLAGAT